MNLKFATVAAVLALSAVSLVPAVSFAATAAKTTTAATAPSAMTPAKPAKPAKIAAVPDAKRFTTEADASKSCPTDTVVWANISSKIFHLKGTATYGKTKNGAYMCETDATAEGFKATKKPEKVTS